MLSSVGLDCDQIDCTKNVLLTARLQAGKAVKPDGSFVKVGGIVHGARGYIPSRRPLNKPLIVSNNFRGL